MSDAGQIARTCHYCGLPAGVSKAGDDHEVYCCFGCRFAAAVAQENGAVGQMRWTLTRLGLAIFFSMNVMVFTLVLWSRDVYPATGNETAIQTLDELLRYFCLIFSIPVLFLLGGTLWESASSELRSGRIGSDLLLIVGVVAAYAYSMASLVTGGRHVYFEVGCMVLVVATLGRWLEATGKLNTTEALHQLAALLPDVVRRVRDGEQSQMPLEEVRVGDDLRVLPGERIPADGQLSTSHALVDEQIITGEFQPREKKRGDFLFGGTLNLDSDLTLEVTAPASEGTIQRMIESVSRAAAAKGRWQRLADRLAQWFLPVVLIVATGTFAGHAYSATAQQGLLSALAVVLIACPCALGLATPMAVWAALGRASMAGVLFRNGEALERLATVRTVAFDKTGTLTTGSPEVDKLVTDGQTTPEEIFAVASSIAQATTHRLAVVVGKFLQDKSPASASRPLNVETLPGRGLIGAMSQGPDKVYFGSARLMQENGLAIPESLSETVKAASERGRPLVMLGYAGRVRAVFVMHETLRPEAPRIIEWARREGLQPVVLTGDGQAAASSLYELDGVDLRAGLLPEEKLAAIAELRSARGAVMMIGDGVNDAPALAAADVGVALGCGADVARDSADVCLLGSDLAQIPWACELARQAVRTIRQNLFWAFGYNIVGIALAAAGWLNPILAAAAMVASSVFVVSNSLRLAGSGSADKLPLPSLESKTSPSIRSRPKPVEVLPASYSGGVSR